MDASAKPQVFGTIRYMPITARALLLQGEIKAGMNDDLRAALRTYPDTMYLVLDSDGGLISEALLMARTIRDHGLATFVAPRSECASACALLWLSGKRRHAAGRVGVHRFATLGGIGLFTDEEGTQDTVGQIVEMVEDMDIPTFVLVPMLRTPHSDVHWFTPQELARLRAGDPVPPNAARDIARLAVHFAPLKSGRSRSRGSAPNPAPERTPAAAPATPRPDCTTLPDATAQALCRDPHLAGLDADLTAATNRASLATPAADMAAFLSRQTDWERARAACKGNIACLERAYTERLTELSGAP
jgi:hypothetical protein